MLHNVGLNPTRTQVLDFLISIGASINLASVQLRDGELIGDVSVRYAPLTGGAIAGPQVAEMIDELPMLAALGARHRARNRNSRRPRIARQRKRPHRHPRRGFAPMGAKVEEFPDGLRVEGSPRENSAAQKSIRRRSSHRHGYVDRRSRRRK